MAKIILENRFILTKKLHAEYCKETFTKFRKRTKITCFVLAFIMLLLSVAAAIFLKSVKLSVMFFVLVLYFIGMAFYGYKFSEWVNYRSMLKEHDAKAIVMLLEFSPVQIHVKVNQTSFSFKYTTVKKIIETENLYIMILSEKGMIEHGQVIFKNGFRSGTEEDFLKIMKEKSGVLPEKTIKD